jgi:hypothetical protein
VLILFIVVFGNRRDVGAKLNVVPQVIKESERLLANAVATRIESLHKLPSVRFV